MKTTSPRRGLRVACRARRLARSIFIGLPLCLLPLAAHAANGAWNIDANGNWSTSSNWLGSAIAGNNPGDVADLAFNITTARTVTVDGSNKIIGVLNVGDPNTTHAYTLGGGTAVYFNNGSSDAQINQLASSKGDTLNAPLGIIGNGVLKISNASANTLTVGGYTHAGGSGAMSLVLDTGSGAIDYKGPIVNGSGTLSVAKNGSGVLKLTGTAGNSTYSGGFSLNTGTLEFGYSQTALGTGVFTINGGVITNGYGAARTNANNNAQVWAAHFAFGSTGSSGQDLHLGNGAVTLTGNRTVTVNSTTAARTLTIGGDIAGSGYGLTKAGAATLALHGANTYSGPTTISAGSLRFGQRASLYNASTASWTAANLVVNSGATAVFNVGGSGEFTASDIDLLKTLGTSSGGFRNGSALGLDTSNASGGAFFYSSAIANPNAGANVLSLVKSGANALVLGGANTHSGGTTLNAGTLALNHASALGSGPLVINGGSLDNTSGSLVSVSTGNSQSWNGHFAFVGTNDLHLGSGAVALGASRVVTVQTSTLTVGGIISGASRGLTLAGNGTLVLGGANTFTGPVVINGGVLVAGVLANGGAASSVGASSNSAANLVLDGGSLRYTGSTATTNRALTLGVNSGTLDASGTGPIAFAHAGSLAFSGAGTPRTLTLAGTNTGDNTLAAVIADNGPGVTSLVKSGPGTWILDGANTYSGGTTVNGGSLVVGATGALGSGNLTITGGSLILGHPSALSGNTTFTFSPSMGAGSINLNFTGVNAIAALTNGTLHAVAGTYTAAQLNTFFGTSVFTGTGSVVVGTWVSVPLGGGGYVTGLVSDSSGTDIYCRTDVGGLFRWVPTTGGNGAWLNLTDSIVPTSTPDASRFLFTASVAVDPNNADNLYIAVGHTSPATTRGIFASSDRGATWTKINPSDDIVMDGNGTYRANGERLAIDPNNANILWFGSTQQGLYKGVKSGAIWTWSQVSSTSVPFGATTATSGKAGISFVACDPNGGSTIVYAGVFDNTTTATGGVYRSTDGGSTWAKVSGVAVNTPARGHVAANGTLYVTGGNVCARLPRGGSLVAITPDTSRNYRGVATDPSDPSGNTVYVAETNGDAQYNRLWRSTNGGANWSTQYQNLNDNRAIPRSEPDGTPSVTGYWFGATSALLVTAADPDTLWAADIFGVARTENAHQLGGASVGSQAIWHMLQVNQEETYPEVLKNAPDGPALMTGMADVGGYRYNDLSQRPTGAAGNKFTAPGEANTNSLDFCETATSFWARTWTGTVDTGSSGGFYGTGARSRDGGATWLLFGEIDRRYMTGPAGWETFDLTDYLIALKARNIHVVTLLLTSDRSSVGGSVLQSFASKETATAANRPTLLLNSGTTLLPTDDATVWGHPNYAGNSFAYSGTAAGNSFDVYYDGANDTWYRQAYLKFDLTNVSTITSAILRIYRTSAATNITVPVGVFACADTTWTETSLTWNNRPKPYASNTGKPFHDPRYTTGAGLTIGGGRVAVSSVNPRQMVWMPFGNATVPHYSDDGGVTWHPSSGLPANVNWKTSQSLPGYLIQQLTADRVNGTFYLQHLYGPGASPKTVYKSVDGGINWTAAGTPPYASGNVWRCQIAAAPVAGHVWTTDDGTSGVSVSGLWKSTNGATSFTRLPSITQVRVVSFGKPPAGSSYQYSTYFVGHYNGVKGVYRSDNYGATWTALPALPSVGDVESIAGDRQTHGSVFLGVGGRGVFHLQ